MKATAAVVLLSGALVPAQAAIPDEVAAMLREVDAARIEESVRILCGFGTRHVLSRDDLDTAGTGAARRWLQAAYEAIAADPVTGGRLTVALESATVPVRRRGMPPELALVNVVATLRGTVDPERIYVVGGHYDSRNSDGTDGEGRAPGAVDDASGTAAALEACRVMSRREFPATILFVAYDGEEQGLLGSGAHAQALAERGAKVDGMITCDIVGNTTGMDGRTYEDHVRCFSYAPTGNDSFGRSLARACTYAADKHLPAADGFGVKLIFRGDRYGRGGDHRSFFEQGYPAVRFSEPREDFSRQHQNVTVRDGKEYGDLPDYANFAYTANVTRVVVATLAELASAPPPPLVHAARLRREAYDTEVDYTPATDAAGEPVRCEFVWRATTAPDWTAVVQQAEAGLEPIRGDRWRATLRGVCLDDVVVGVRSVGAGGHRSRVATPPEPDRFTNRTGGGR
ncbi:MAG: M20/M25/M40 family metallo-hydrolase [Planctomycetes bacterium]|nr:M20/M25/M40 family metallo-hydrolase [Planctomycetota bacterium]